MNELGAEFWATPFPRVADAASGGALHVSLPGAMYVLTSPGWMIAGNHFIVNLVGTHRINATETQRCTEIFSVSVAKKRFKNIPCNEKAVVYEGDFIIFPAPEGLGIETLMY